MVDEAATRRPRRKTTEYRKVVFGFALGAKRPALLRESRIHGGAGEQGPALAIRIGRLWVPSAPRSLRRRERVQLGIVVYEDGI